MKIKNYDYYLIVLTTVILFLIGLVCLFGIAYFNYFAVSPEWTRSIQYEQFIVDMNSYLYPFIVFLLICLGLCIPKRLFEQNILMKFNILIFGITFLLAVVRGIETGLGFILMIMTGVQVIVFFFTIKDTKTIRFEKEGYYSKLGSSFLHLGLIILISNFVIIKESSFHVSIFWAGMFLITSGNIISFYPDKIASLLRSE
jgi:hypothetical protein